MNHALLRLLADAAATAGADAAEMPTGMNAVIYYAVQLLPMILIFVVFYFILIRPQRKKDKEARDMLAALKVGDQITTIGGIYATIIAIKDDTLVVELGAKGQQEKTQMTIARWAVKNVNQLTVSNDAETLI